MSTLDKIEDYVDFLINHKITPNQHLLLYLFFSQKMNRNCKWGPSSLISKLQASESNGWSVAEIKDLVDKGFLLDISKSGISLDKLILTSKFSENNVENDIFAFEDFFKSYPSTIQIKNDTAFLKAVDPETIEKLYNDLIQSSVYTHQEFMELLEYGKERGLVRVRIDKYFTARIWETIQIMKDEDEKGEDYGRELR